MGKRRKSVPSVALAEPSHNVNVAGRQKSAPVNIISLASTAGTASIKGRRNCLPATDSHKRGLEEMSKNDENRSRSARQHSRRSKSMGTMKEFPAHKAESVKAVPKAQSAKAVPKAQSVKAAPKAQSVRAANQDNIKQQPEPTPVTPKGEKKLASTSRSRNNNDNANSVTTSAAPNKHRRYSSLSNRRFEKKTEEEDEIRSTYVSHVSRRSKRCASMKKCPAPEAPSVRAAKRLKTANQDNIKQQPKPAPSTPKQDFRKKSRSRKTSYNDDTNGNTTGVAPNKHRRCSSPDVLRRRFEKKTEEEDEIRSTYVSHVSRRSKRNASMKKCPAPEAQSIRATKQQKAASKSNVKQQPKPAPVTSNQVSMGRRRSFSGAKSHKSNGNDNNHSDSGISLGNLSVSPATTSSRKALSMSGAGLRKKSSVKKKSKSKKDEDSFEVEKILDYKKEKPGHEFYFIKWKNYDESHNCWEPAGNLNCTEKVDAFKLEREKKIIAAILEYQSESSSAELPTLKDVLSKFPMPADDRPIHKKIKFYFKITKKPSTKEKKAALMQLQKTDKADRWSNAQVEAYLFDLRVGNKVLGTYPSERTQMLFVEVEHKRDIQLKALTSWEAHLNGIAKGRPIITVKNDVDFEGPPTTFKYINSYEHGKGVVVPDTPPVGCGCKGSCLNSKTCCPQMSNTDNDFAYDTDKRLKVLRGTPIYECNKLCKCGPTCSNRVVQDGWSTLTGLKMCIFKTTNKGWGVRTLKPIKKGTFVALYAGEIIKQNEADLRGKTYDRHGKTYLFDLDFNGHLPGECPYVVDAAHKGNFSHFINHSCEPNLVVFNVWSDCLDPDLAMLALFAVKDIAKHEELSFDYGTHDKNKKKKRKKLSSKDVENGARVSCHCGAKTCRKILF